ncbi:MAG: hypothetical protein ACXQTI_07675, partial [Candidatus Nezhaarchaeales archaeon]
SYYTGEQASRQQILKCWRCGSPINQSEVIRTAIHVNKLEKTIQELQNKLDSLLGHVVKPSLREKDVKMIIDLDEDVSEITPEKLAEILEKKSHIPDLVIMRDGEEVIVENREDIVKSENKAYLYKAYMIDGKIVLEPIESDDLNDYHF